MTAAPRGLGVRPGSDQVDVMPVARVIVTRRLPRLTVVVTHPAGSRPVVVDALLDQDDVAVVAVPHGPGADAPTPAAALAEGMATSASPLVGWIDGDVPGDPALLPLFARVLELYEGDAVVGSKQHPDSEVGLRWRRRAGGRGYRLLLRLLFGTRLADPRVGIKVFRRGALDAVLPRCQEEGAGAALEVLVLLHRSDHRRVIEAPVRVDRRVAPSLGVRGAWRLGRDTLALRRRLGR